MEEIESSPGSPNPRKRSAPNDESPQKKLLNLKGTQFLPTPPDTDGSSNASPTCTAHVTARHSSPAPSNSTLTSVDIADSTAMDAGSNNAPAASAPSGSAPRAVKRRKLTPAEKEQQKQEKEAKEAEKAIQKVKRDEEKRVKDEEKRKKAEERDAKKREKEVEEERKAQEKLKKERAQMRLGAFFQKPATPVKISEDGEVQPTTARRKSLSLEPFDAVADHIRQSLSPCKGAAQAAAEKIRTPVRPVLSDYNKYFLPFQLQSHHYMAPVHPPEDAAAAQEAFDHDIADPSLREKYGLGLVDAYVSLERQFAADAKCARGQSLSCTRQLVDEIQGTIQRPIDLTADEAPTDAMSALRMLSQRYLEFDVDVRPPYFGTYTKIRSPRTTTKLRRNPFTRARKDTDYDYDSEAEWEEPEEGDDECIDEEDEAESQGDAEDMDEFLDDEEDAAKNKRKMITGDLVPSSTGLCWENETGRIRSGVDGDASVLLREMRIGVLLPDFSGSTIDPFSTSYWDEPIVEPKSIPIKVTEPSASPWSGLMAPPRAPLQPRANNSSPDHMLVGAAEGMKGPITSVAATQGSRGRPKSVPKVLSKEDLDEFKDAVVGSQISKADLLKGLKARFPKLTKETIKDTLGEHFAQVGANKAKKKWVFVSV